MASVKVQVSASVSDRGQGAPAVAGRNFASRQNGGIPEYLFRRLDLACTSSPCVEVGSGAPGWIRISADSPGTSSVATVPVAVWSGQRTMLGASRTPRQIAARHAQAAPI